MDPLFHRVDDQATTGKFFSPFSALLLILVTVSTVWGQQPASGSPTTEPGNSPRPSPRAIDPDKVHDPSSIVVTDGIYRFFCTGPGISLMRESSSGKWELEGRVFGEGQFPLWHERSVPGNRGYLWAPDVVRIGEKFFLYYSVSTFGKNTSAIGLAVGDSINPAAADWKWDDRGPVITSRAEDRFNAIDPAIFHDDTNGKLWMAFGSFWDGIFLVELDPATGLRRDPTGAPLHLAFAPEIEAPFLHRRDGYYYLFLNWGKCCRGIASTYEIRVGRSRNVTGPYFDRMVSICASKAGRSCWRVKIAGSVPATPQSSAGMTANGWSTITTIENFAADLVCVCSRSYGTPRVGPW